MKKQLFTIALAILTLAFSQTMQAKDMTGQIGISLYGGAGIPTNGYYTDGAEMIDVIDLGGQFGLGVSYFFTEGLGVELFGNYGFNYYTDEYAGSLEPVMSDINVSLNAVYNFGHLFDQTLVSPIARVGVGVYNWSHLDDGLDGDDIIYEGEELSGSSFGMNVGLGIEFNVIENMAIGLLVDYNMYFPEDEEKFGTEFAEQGFVSPQLKVSYYLPTK